MESFQSALKKLPTALKNMSIDEKSARMLENYFSNLIIVILQDTELVNRLKQDKLAEVLKEIKEL